MNRLIDNFKALTKRKSWNGLLFLLLIINCGVLPNLMMSQAPIPLSCNDVVQVSLDEECEAELEFDMFLEGDYNNNYMDLNLRVRDEYKQIVIDYPTTSAILDGNYIKRHLTYEIYHSVTKNSCWGKLWIEDHIPPTVSCEDMMINCANSIFPGDPIVERYEFDSYSLVLSGANNEIATLSFAPGFGMTNIHDVRLFLNVEAEPLSRMSAAIRIPSGEKRYVFQNPLEYSDDMNCLDSGIVGWFDDKFGKPNKELKKSKNCRLQTTPSIFGKFHSLDTISHFRGEVASGTWEVIFEMESGTSFDPDWINHIVLEILIEVGRINIPVWDDGAEFEYIGKNQFKVIGLGLCDAVLAEFKDVRTDDCFKLDETGFIGKIKRCWTIHDASGNSATCCEHIYLRQSDMEDLVCPPNYDDNDLPAFDCPSDFAGYALPSGAPSPHVTGYPYDNFSLHKELCSNMQTAFDDQIIRLNQCGSSFKVVRNWTILDWCNSHIDYCVQIIKVVDDVQPVLECPEEYVVYMDSNPYKCGVDFKVPPPKVIYECNSYTWTVEYLITGEYGDCSPPKSTVEYEDKNVYIKNGEVFIHDLPMGCNWIRYIVTDECGNVSEGKCRVEVKVKDNIPPVPVCDETTTVAVTIDGYAVLHAFSLDDGSWDNCMVDSFAVAKMTDICHDEKDPAFQANIFQDKVKFCCEEVGETLRVRLRVWDKYDNYNDCMVMVEVQDKIPPHIICPPDLTLDCQTDHKNLEITGIPDYYDNCIVNEPSFEDIEYLNQCGTGHLYRVWTVADKYGFKSTCTQHIYLRDFDPFEMEDRDFPPDIELTECFADASPEITGYPNLDDDDKCSLVATTYEDQVFKFVDDACRKIIREWTVIDWCQFEDYDECIVPSRINKGKHCRDDYDPVCGCNGVTYANACEAEYYGGVKLWIKGPCNKECKTPLNLTEIYDKFGEYTSDSELREIKWDNKFYYVLFDSLNCDDLYDPWTIHSDTLVFDCLGSLICQYGVNEEDCPWFGEELPEGRVVWDCEGLPEITYEAETGIPGLWRLSQVIKVNNYEGPVFTSSCEDREICSYGPGCGGEIVLTASAMDDCTDEGNLEWHWMIYKYGEGYPNYPAYSGHGNDASGYYPDGPHRIVWTVEDQCGNVARCDYYFTVVDCKAPTPYCISSITTVVMPSNGQARIWARDFDNGSDDNCTPKNKLKFSFTEDVDDQSILLDCSDIPDGKSEYIQFDIWVTDEAGNQDYCYVELNLQDNVGNFCEDANAGSASISGTVRTMNRDNVMNVEVKLDNKQLSEFPKTTVTNEQGDYSFTGISLGYDYKLTASKADNAINGVSTFDLVLIQQHIIGTRWFDSPYQLIAADADNNGRVTAADLVQIRKLILGVADEFTNGQKNWIFVDGRQEFDDENNPFPYDEVLDIASMNGNARFSDFIAIKTGDVNGSAKVNRLDQIEVRNDRSLDFVFNYDPGSVRAGHVVVPVTADHFDEIFGFQFTLQFDIHKLKFHDLKTGSLQIDISNLGLRYLDQGLLTMSWNDTDVRTFDSKEVLFYLEFELSGEIGEDLPVVMSSELTASEAYPSDYGTIRTRLEIRNTGAAYEANELSLFQNKPNPFSEYTTIGFFMDNDSEATLTIHDFSGKVLWRESGSFSKGMNEVTVRKSDMGVNGVLYYSLESQSRTLTKKMIGIE